MATTAQRFTEIFKLAAAAFSEGSGSIADAAAMPKEEAKPSIAYGFQVMTSGFTQIETLSRRYAARLESEQTEAKRVLADPLFRGAASECADKLDETVPAIGLPAKRIAAIIRRWIETSDPAEVRALAMACNAAHRASKTKSGRAAA